MENLTASGLRAEHLIDTLSGWDRVFEFPLHLIACGDAALTLLKFRSVTQEVDLLIPRQSEYEQCMALLPTVGLSKTPLGFSTDATPYITWRFWPGTTIFGAHLVESPLEGANYTPITTWGHLSLGVLNLKDLIITHIFRGLPTDVNDCIALFKTWKVDAEELLERYAQTSKYAEYPDERMQKFMEFVEQLASHQLVSDEVWERLSRSREGLRKDQRASNVTAAES